MPQLQSSEPQTAVSKSCRPLRNVSIANGGHLDVQESILIKLFSLLQSMLSQCIHLTSHNSRGAKVSLMVDVDWGRGHRVTTPSHLGL
jgi:hypothetical protein